MGQYISKYTTIADYEAAVASGLDTPHTALVKENMEVYFHEYVEPPKNIITYKAPAKLVETTSGSSGLHTNAFNGKDGQLTMTNHTFENGVGTIEFDEDVTKIGQNAFFRCGAITSINIPNSVTSIGKSAFHSCTGLTTINIPDSVRTIGPSAFCGCTGLTTINIPNSVTFISNYPFQNCSGLTSIICNATTAPTIQSNTFQYINPGGTLYIPTGSTGYDTWMQNANYYLGLYGWTKVEQ